MRGIIELLSDALYTDESVFIRELIQNAVDAITARKHKDPEVRGLVRIQFCEGDDSMWSLSIEDNGIGLSRDEIHEFLAVIGSSTKRGDLVEQRNKGYIGQFGVGFLSCFMVADEVTLVTRRSGDDHSPALRWTGQRDGTYTVSECDFRRGPGACVSMKLRKGTRRSYDGPRLFNLARRYARFLPERLMFAAQGEGEICINPEPFPWCKRYANKATQQREWIRFAEGKECFDQRFIAAFPIQARDGAICGIACISRARVTALDDLDHIVYLRGMFLSDEVSAVAPPSMPFLRCIINVDDLKPNAARDGIQDSEVALFDVRESVAKGLVDFLYLLEKTQIVILEELLATHYQDFLKLACENDGVRDIAARYIKLETSLGNLTLAEVSKHPTAWYIGEYDEFKKAEAFAFSRDILVINAGYQGFLEFLEIVRDQGLGGNLRHTTLAELRKTERQHSVVMTPRLKAFVIVVRQVLHEFAVNVELYSEPSGDAAFVELTAGRRLESRLDGDLPTLLRGKGNSDGATFGLNASHPTIQHLCDHVCEANLPRAVLEGMIGCIYYVAFLEAKEQPSKRQKDFYRQCCSKVLSWD
jgi:molecular chaperone HtpG